MVFNLGFFFMGFCFLVGFGGFLGTQTQVYGVRTLFFWPQIQGSGSGFGFKKLEKSVRVPGSV